jgi:hypothetical protein
MGNVGIHSNSIKGLIMKQAMKKVALVLALGMATMSVNANAVSITQEGVGCGIGTMVFKDKTGLVYSILASTTNGLTFNSISLTFGLINCPQGTSINGKIASFIDYNKQQLAVETAQGQGEHLAAIVDMYGVKEANRAAAISALKANQVAIFSSESTAEIQSAMDKTLQAFVS